MSCKIVVEIDSSDVNDVMKYCNVMAFGYNSSVLSTDSSSNPNRELVTFFLIYTSALVDDSVFDAYVQRGTEKCASKNR
jgi:hypothetical protein